MYTLLSRAILVISSLLLVSIPCHAAIKVVGKGDRMTLDPSGFPPQQKSAWLVFKVKCIKCHTMERTIVSINTGLAPITGQPFDRNAVRAYGIKMMRKPDSDMNKQEVKVCVDLMNWLLDEVAK